ncbi:MAG: biotin synthase [Methanomassiliicoccales archaeon PtaU1.Bin124]|nr:MAG: biotin synthase [Methanomassiliicoccales archaeon PtaU1.Bin124]
MAPGMSSIEKKAILLAGGKVRLPTDYHPPFRASRSTAGPGAGSTSMVFCFEGLRVKKAISREEGEFELVVHPDHLSLTHHGMPFLDIVEMQPTIYHCPEQAFINLHQECIYDCKFCTSPRLPRDTTKNLDKEKVRRMIESALENPDLKAIAITSAVVGSPERTSEEMLEVVRMVREMVGPDMPIGVEPYISRLEDIDRFREAGANEIKLNIETFDKEIFRKVCGDMDIDNILRSLQHAVKVFGRGKVTSNIIFGMGETDENVLEGVEDLAGMGVVVSLRPLRVNDINRKPLIEALGEIEPMTPERIIRLSKAAKAIYSKYGLTPLSYETMCHRCRCCDIVPFADF